MKLINALAYSALLVAPVLAALTVTYSDVSGSKFNAIVTSDKGVTILKHPNTVAAPEFDTDIFTFESEGGKAPDFIGIAIKWDPKSSKTVELKAGESVVFQQDLSKIYDFSKGGDTTYKLSGGNVFYILSPSGEITTETATVTAATVKFSSPETHKRDYTPVDGSLEKVITFRGCSTTQQTITRRALGVAQNYITGARAYLLQHTASTPRWARWFGTFTIARRNFVMDRFSKMVNDPFNIRYDCSTCLGTPSRNAYAYVYPNDPTAIYLCGAFWLAPVSGVDSKGAAIVRELLRFNVNGGCNTVGPVDAHTYAADPIYNCDSYENFAVDSFSRP